MSATIPTGRALVVNADDFGRSRSLNRGIIETHENGILTSASMMVRWPAATEAAAYARGNQRLGVGLHIDLGEWKYTNGEWKEVYLRVDLNDPDSVRTEIDRQLQLFFELIGTAPSHIDSHQHVHLRNHVLPHATEVARRLGIPLRERTAGLRYCGEFYGQTGEGLAIDDALSIGSLEKILAGLGDGVTELGCHPGYASDFETVYGNERTREVATLCAPEIATAVRVLSLRLTSFKDLIETGWRAELLTDASTVSR